MQQIKHVSWLLSVWHDALEGLRAGFILQPFVDRSDTSLISRISLPLVVFFLLIDARTKYAKRVTYY
jgi:hypothetical protein